MKTARVVYRKQYRDPAACQRALANYHWLAALGAPLGVPQLIAVSECSLTFDLIRGHHVRPADLAGVAGHLGEVHAAGYVSDLRLAQLNQAFLTPDGHQLTGFAQHRTDAVRRELKSGHVVGSLLSATQAVHMITTAAGPAAFYKDTNPRNFLITADGLVMVDFDDLTLAPFGYDLAKLVVTLAMTHGSLAAAEIRETLAAYNAAVGHRQHGIPAVTWEQFMGWAEIHHILTSRYAAFGSYRYSWHQVRPNCMPTGA